MTFPSTVEKALNKTRYRNVFVIWPCSILCYNEEFLCFQCKICDYNSLTQGGLDKHVRIYHDLHDRQFACKHCSYRGLKRRQLLDHERIVHNQDKNKYWVFYSIFFTFENSDSQKPKITSLFVLGMHVQFARKLSELEFLWNIIFHVIQINISIPAGVVVTRK